VVWSSIGSEGGCSGRSVNGEPFGGPCGARWSSRRGGRASTR
jgi:hypothetical protein